MLHLTWRELIHAGARSVLSALAVGGVLALVLVFEGFRVGTLEQLRAFPRDLPADLVVVQEGVENFAAARSSLRQMTRRDVESVEGVRVAHPLVSLPVIFEWGERRVPIQVVVYESAGGPRRLAAGRPAEEPRELVMDARLARHLEMGVGTDVELMGYEMEVVGLSEGTSSPFAPYAFMTYDALIKLYLEADLSVGGGLALLLGDLLVEVDDGADAAVVRERIEAAVGDVDVYTPAELGAHDVALGERLLGPALDLLVGIAWVIAWLTMALTLYANAQARTEEYGVVKAIGARRGQLGLAMTASSLAVTLLGFPLALLMARGVAGVVWELTPLYVSEPWLPGVVGRAAVAAVVTACLGAVPALVHVARVDPVAVMRGGVA